jgi:hypothetical protein
MEIIILTICKLLGTGVAVIMGVLGILFETHDKVIKDGLIKRKKLNKVGRIFLTLTIVSGTIALTAQIIEATMNRAAENEKNARDQAVLKTLQDESNKSADTLKELSRVNTKFERISGNIAFHMKITGAGSDSFIATHQNPSKMAPTAENFDFIELAPYETALNTNSSDAEARMLAVLIRPVLVLKIWPNGYSGRFMDQVGISAHFKLTRPPLDLIYFPWAKSAQVTWQVDCPKENMESDLKITSISDLDNARLRLYVLNAQPNDPRFRVGDVVLQFDSTRINIRNFKQVSDSVMAFEAVLPSAKDILAGKPATDQPLQTQ